MAARESHAGKNAGFQEGSSGPQEAGAYQAPGVGSPPLPHPPCLARSSRNYRPPSEKLEAVGEAGMGQGSRSHPVPSRTTDKPLALCGAFCPSPPPTRTPGLSRSLTLSGKPLASVPSHIFHHMSCLNRTPGFPSPLPLSGSKSPSPIRPLSWLWAPTLPLSSSSVLSDGAIPYVMFTQTQSQKR